MKQKILIISSTISILGIIGWMISDFFGGMFIYLLMYWWIIIPLLIIYGFTGLITLVKIIRKGLERNKILFYIHIFGLSVIVLFNLNQSEMLKSRILLKATLKDDLSSITLVLRNNGHFETTSNGVFGYTEKNSGKYLIKNDTIIFLNKPYSNDYIPDKVVIDKKGSAIYFKMDTNGQFSREKSFVNYFDITKNEIKN